MINLAPYWQPPSVGIPNFPITVPSDVALVLSCLWLALFALSLAGILWAAMHNARRSALGKGASLGRPHGSGRRRPALYPV